MTLKARMQRMAIFQGLDDEVLDTLAEAAQVGVYESGGVVFCQDDAVSKFYVLMDGQVKITRGTSTGREQTLYIVEPGEPFCFCTLFGQVRQPVNASALKSATILTIQGEAFEKTAYNNTSFLLNIMEVLNQRLMNSMRMIEDLALRGIPQRLASFLLHSAGMDGGGADEAIHLTVPKHEVARILGTTPETLSRVFSKMSADGLIRVRKRRIDILDPEGLDLLAGS